MQARNLPIHFFLLPALLLFTFISKAQLLTQSFDNSPFPPTGWQNNQIGGGADIWSQATTTIETAPNNILPHSGTGMALYDAFTFAPGEAAELVTPSLNFSTGGSFQVRFWMYRDTRFTSNDDSLEIFVNTIATADGGTKLGGIWRQIADPPVVGAAGWYEYTFEIPAGFNTATNYIAFVANSDYGTEMVIDDVVVEPVPSCQQPSGLLAIGISPTSDSIQWSKRVTAANYQWAVTTSSTPPASGTATASNNDTAILASGLLPSTQYYAYVRSDCGGGVYSSWASVSFISISANDLCSGAIDVSAMIATNIADTIGKGTVVTAGAEGSSANAPCSATSTGGINDVWYKFTAPANGDSVIIAGAAGSSDDWVYQLFASCNTGQLACSDDGDVQNPFGDLYMPTLGTCGLTPGATYYIRAYPYLPGSNKTCVLYIYAGGSCPVPPTNDQCTDAIDITSSCGNPVNGTTVNASASGNIANSNCGSLFANQTDVWYKFNTGSTMMLPYVRVTNIDISDGKTVYASVYHGSNCSSLIYDGCVDAGATDSIIAFISGVDANQDYYVRIYSIANLEQTSFNISICDSTSTLLVDTTGRAICSNWGAITINAANQNNNRWVRIINSGLITEINANGNDLGATSFSVYRNMSGSIRRDASNAPQLGTEYMDRNITITPTNQPATPVSVRMYFTNAELNALIAAGGDNYNDVLSINNLVVTKNQQPCATSFIAGNNETLIAPASSGTFADGAFVQFSVSSFSSFFLNGGFAPLPVTLINFTAQRNGRINKLNWSTSQEINARYFVIERSNDTRNYIPIGQITASGTSSINQAYSFTDNLPAKGINYYRLRIVDNGSSASRYSIVRNIRNEGTADIAVYPNPVKSVMNLDITSDKNDKAALSITDLSGKLVYSKIQILNEGPNKLLVPTSNFANGAYIIKVQLSEDIIVRKFNKL